MKKTISAFLSLFLIAAMCTSAFALPNPKTAYYPRGGALKLYSSKQMNNTYAFKPAGKADTKLVLTLDNAYAATCGSRVSIQLFIVNKWGNWIAFGPAQTLELMCQPTSKTYTLPIREGKEFCIVITAIGESVECEIPYRVETR